ncbi:MAG: hypothetical protein F6K28_28090, partial [Microcoleus sp. SIO2G3]|nr:hypothetical protein [Microcoleus sp. SIO2G3]
MNRSPLPDSPLISSIKRIAQAAGAITFFVGLIVLIGWLFNLSILKSVLPNLVTMKANTALAFLLSGVSLWLLHLRLVHSALSKRLGENREVER